jgi:hypothetical protein
MPFAVEPLQVLAGQQTADEFLGEGIGAAYLVTIQTPLPGICISELRIKGAIPVCNSGVQFR